MEVYNPCADICPYDQPYPDYRTVLIPQYHY